MATIDKRPLKAYVRFDGTGRIVPSSLILRRKKPKVGNWVEIPAYECCNDTTTTATPALRLLFDDIENANTLVGDASNLEDWNTFFDLPAFGNPFTSVQVVGNEVKLYGGFNIVMREELFYDNQHITSVYDDAGSIIELEGYVFNYPEYLITVFLPNVTKIGEDAFDSCYGLINISMPKLIEIVGINVFSGVFLPTTISFPLLEIIPDRTFYPMSNLENISLSACTNLGSTVGNNQVFQAITGNNVTLTIPAALMTCNSGNPDGDIQYLQANNTVTVITV